MAAGAADLVDHILPVVADYRQWTLSFPRWLRIRLLRDKALVSEVLLVFVRVVSAYHRRRARHRGIAGGQTGAVTAIQRVGSFANANLHFHTLVPEGVWHERPDGSLGFHLLPPLTDEDIGISLDGGKTIIGFTPDVPEGMETHEAMGALMKHEAFPGVVGDDTHIFLEAAALARDRGWSTELAGWVHPMNAETAEQWASFLNAEIADRLAGTVSKYNGRVGRDKDFQDKVYAYEAEVEERRAAHIKPFVWPPEDKKDDKAPLLPTRLPTDDASMVAPTKTDANKFEWALTDEVIRLREWASDCIFPLPQELNEAVLGTSDECQVRLSDPSGMTSRMHARLLTRT